MIVSLPFKRITLLISLATIWQSLYLFFEILNNLEKFKILDIPILVGFSRKSMIYKTLKTNSENALNGTSALNTIALTKGVKILRVHDVKEAKECIILHEKTISSLFWLIL